MISSSEFETDPRNGQQAHLRSVRPARSRIRRRGVAAVEYATLLALICAVIVGAVASLGQSVNNAFAQINFAMESAPDPVAMPGTAFSPPSAAESIIAPGAP